MIGEVIYGDTEGLGELAQQTRAHGRRVVGFPALKGPLVHAGGDGQRATGDALGFALRPDRVRHPLSVAAYFGYCKSRNRLLEYVAKGRVAENYRPGGQHPGLEGIDSEEA